MQSQFTIIDMIMQGWYATYPLLIISIVCVTIIIERIWALWGTGGFWVVAAGISEALLSTALGLAVAIIAVIFYNYFSQRIERINATIHIGAARLIDAAVAGKQANGN